MQHACISRRAKVRHVCPLPDGRLEPVMDAVEHPLWALIKKLVLVRRKCLCVLRMLDYILVHVRLEHSYLARELIRVQGSGAHE